jgi:hypothetical protein
MEITMSEKQNRVTLIGLDGPVVSRRALLRGTVLGAAAAGTGALSACMPMMARGVPRNVPKAFALYQDRPNGRQRCGRCMHFLPPNRCEIVNGRISPQGWCRYFEALA